MVDHSARRSMATVMLFIIARDLRRATPHGGGGRYADEQSRAGYWRWSELAIPLSWAKVGDRRHG